LRAGVLLSCGVPPLQVRHAHGCCDGCALVAHNPRLFTKKELPMSLRKLVGWTVFDLVLALLIGTGLAIAVFATMFPYRPARELAFCYGLNSLGVPLSAPGLRETYERVSGEWRYTFELNCHVTPADDQALEDWLRGQGAFAVEHVWRRRTRYSSGVTSALVSISLIGPKGRELPEVPWEQLGYKPASSPPYWEAHGPFMQDGPPRAAFLLIYLAFLQVGFAVVGLFRWWRNRRVASGAPPRGEGQSLPVAVGVGLVLAGLLWATLQAVRFLLGPVTSQQAFLHYVPSVAWFMPPRASAMGPMVTVPLPFLQLVVGVIIVLGAPLVQELFFRGGMVGMWASANRFWAGAVLSALTSALLILDWTLLPVLLVAGLALAWLYRWSGSLLAPLLAHILFNAAMLCMIYGLIPSLPHPVEQLCGQWTEVEIVDPKGQGKDAGGIPPPKRADDQTVTRLMLVDSLTSNKRPEIEFLRGGTIRGGRVVSKSVQLTPLRYEWVGPDEIEVRWERNEIVSTMTDVVTLEFVRYKVAVNWDELTLTRKSDGMVFRYRRDEDTYRGKVSMMETASRPAKRTHTGFVNDPSRTICYGRHVAPALSRE
jgi:membrane protease YdiL (CAAX protease family)